MSDLNDKKVAILVAEMFEQVELTEPRKALENAGATTEIVSLEEGEVRGRRLTSFASIQTDIRNAGGDWVDEEVVVDGNLVTSRQPDDIPAFNEKMIELFAEARPRVGADSAAS